MLRHFKMELLKRQEAEEQKQAATAAAAAMPTKATTNSQRTQQTQLAAAIIGECPEIKSDQSAISAPMEKPNSQRPKSSRAPTTAGSDTRASAARSRSRRASKPQMEKRRRARINECLDILKCYVLTDSSNLAHLGIDPAASENQDEETIARTILKSSGLIHRHRGRKNPNKLEKADILELTVDYVRRLHEQRNDLLSRHQQQQLSENNEEAEIASSSQQDLVINLKMAHNSSTDQNNPQQQHQHHVLQFVPAHLSEPLTLDLSPKSRVLQQQHSLLNGAQPDHLLMSRSSFDRNYTCPLTPPPSSASSIRSGASDDAPPPAGAQSHATQQMLLSRVLDNFKLYETLPYQQRC